MGLGFPTEELQMPQVPLLVQVQRLPRCAIVAATCANLLWSLLCSFVVLVLIKMRVATACNSQFHDATDRDKSLQAQLNGCRTNELSPLCC